MFARLAGTIALALAIPMVAATPAPLTARTDICNTGSLQCCNMAKDGSPTANAMGALLGVAVPVGGFLAMNCNPISVVGALGVYPLAESPSSVLAQNGLVNVGCSPIAL
ncbi:hypothetical protein EST38_g6219 [Candolleomyces aberdarensis]|uniref:Hydrophobin n=1 Tax=Candolleomyces aberdarensis TaxID=2316362 RepID=A0A4Q2DL69_9AGAR|nr:hypothetical protein EST38_g6219 [Candolleomyces aberdarensis]